MLASNLEAPEVTETSMLANLLHALLIFSESSVNNVGVNLGPGTVLDASLSVQEPLGDTVFGGLGEDVTDLVDLLLGEVAGASVAIDLGDLAGQHGESPSDTLDGAEGERHLVLSVDVRVKDTNQIGELGSARQDDR